MDVIVSKFFNLHTVLTLINCCRKIYTDGIHDQGGQENLSDVHKKAYLAFDCKDVGWSLPLSKLCHPTTPNACLRSPRGNLWHRAVSTRVRTPGSNCW